MKAIYEHVDSSTTAPLGAIYSWILDRPTRNEKAALARDGWKAVGNGAMVTNDPDLVAITATEYGVDVTTNGTHIVLGVPGLLCVVTDPAVVAEEKRKARNARARANRRARGDALDSIGMRRVRGNLGGTYYE